MFSPLCNIQTDMSNGAGIFGIVVALLVLKTTLLLFALIHQRKREKRINAPEDGVLHGMPGGLSTAAQPLTTTSDPKVDEWSTQGRITKVLANDNEYVPLFLVLYFALLVLIGDHATRRMLAYGIIFVVGRYTHTICYIYAMPRGRVFGFILSFLTNAAMALDLAITLNRRAPYAQ